MLLLSPSQVWLVTFPRQTRSLEVEAEIALQASCSTFVPEAALFHRVFPFHMVIDKELRVRQVRNCGSRPECDR